MSRWALVALLLGVACEQGRTPRPTGYFGSSRVPPRIVGAGGGGGGGDADAGVDGGVPDDGFTVAGRVVSFDDLTVLPDDAVGVAERQVSAIGASGGLVATVSAGDGAFVLEGVARADTIVLSVSGEPPSFVVLDRDRRDDAVAPVMEEDVLEAIASSQSLAIDDVAGHAIVWLQGAGRPLAGLDAEVVSAAPVQGPFYGGVDPTTVVDAPPTVETGLVVLLDAVPDEVELSVFRADDPTEAALVALPIEDGVVTFQEFETGF